MEGKQLYLKPDEAKFLAMAVVSQMEQIQETATDQTLPWNPETRKDFKEMLAAANSLKVKMAKLGFDMKPLPDYNTGDENQFFTKPS